MDKRIAPGGKPKHTKEEKLKKVEDHIKIIEQLKLQLKSSTDENEKLQLKKQIINQQTKKNRLTRSIEQFYPTDTTSTLTKMKRKKVENFNQFKQEKLNYIEQLKRKGFINKAKEMQEQLYFAELHYKYSIA